MKKLNFNWKIGIVSLFVGLFALTNSPVHADETVNIHVRIESDTSTILDQYISVPETCEVADSSGTTSTHSGFSGICVLQVAQDEGLFTYELQDFEFGLFLNAVNGIGGGATMFWSLYVNNNTSFVGLTDLTLADQDAIVLAYVDWNFSNELLLISTDIESAEVGNIVNLTTQEFVNGIATNYESEVSFYIDGELVVAPSGTLAYTPDTEGTQEIYVEAEGKVRSEKISLKVLPASEPTPSEESQTEENQVHLDIRYQNTLLFSDEVTIPYSTSTLDSSGTAHPLETNNVLKALLIADEQSDDFAVTDLQYNQGWSSFYLRCIEIQTPSTTSACDNWQYTVNGQYHYFGMDAFELDGGEHIYIYYGGYTLDTEKTEYTIAETITSTLKEYDFTNNTWQLKPNQIVLFTEPIAPDYSNWPPHEFSSSTTNELGEAYFNQTSTGTFYITLPNDYWPGIIITVTTTPSVSEDVMPVSNHGSSGGNTTPTKSDLQIMIDKAFSYVISQQHNGGFENLLFSDWVAMAFGKYDLSTVSGFDTAKNALKNYLTSEQPSLSSLTDYERHVLGLSALGISSDTYTTYILNSFDGAQFGIDGLNNDDIFAILALCSANKCNESSVSIATKYIKDDIDADTSGDLYGVDMTSASVRALLKKYDKTDTAIVKAINYLKTHQNNNASFGSSGLELDSTTWTLDTIGALSETSFNGWTKNNNTPFTYLKSAQNEDGSFGSHNKVWSTAYALIGLAYNWSGTAGTENNEQLIMNNGQLPVNSDQQTTSTSTPTSTPTGIETPTSTPTSTVEIGEGEKIVSEEIEENTEILEITKIIRTQVSSNQNIQTSITHTIDTTDIRGQKIEEEQIDEVKDTPIETPEPITMKEIDSKNSETNNNSIHRIPAILALLLAGGFGVWRLMRYVI
ncbi:MAG: DUF4430 domain-containing protein [Candidatus Magasanikbacteria bacterium]|nr:DUF4430 domain-containing protein [Candidatus Magasanikbacteria bacterium]